MRKDLGHRFAGITLTGQRNDARGGIATPAGAPDRHLNNHWPPVSRSGLPGSSIIMSPVDKITDRGVYGLVRWKLKPGGCRQSSITIRKALKQNRAAVGTAARSCVDQ